jgi:hypothetical protein
MGELVLIGTRVHNEALYERMMGLSIHLNFWASVFNARRPKWACYTC